MTRRGANRIVEDLIVQVERKDYRGILTIIPIDGSTSAFEVDYGDRHWSDSSLFRHGAIDQIRIHAQSVLIDLVKEELSKKGPKHR